MTHTFTEYTPIEYLKIDIASNFGEWNGTDLEKLDFADRIKWFDEQETNNNLINLIDQAEKPPLYFAGLRAYADAIDGKPIGYPISLDACSSGLQILATLSNCEKSALRCGIVSTGHREDAYLSLFSDMQDRSTRPMQQTRKHLKQAVMTSLYGSTMQPKILFGDGTPELKLFYEVMEEEIPGAWELNLALKGLWQPYATEHSWTLPDGFDVSMSVDDVVCSEVQFLGEPIEVYTKEPRGTRTGLSLSPNIVHSIDGMIVREIVRRCSFNRLELQRAENAANIAIKRRVRRESTKGQGRQKDKLLKRVWNQYCSSGFLSSRIIGLIDENNINIVSAYKVLELIQTLPLDPFPVLTVHDCFRVHPNYANDLRRQYNHIMSQLAASNVLGDIATQITGRKLELMKVGDISAKILNADYALS